MTDGTRRIMSFFSLKTGMAGIARRLAAGARRAADALLARLLGGPFLPDSALHVSYMVHVPYYTTRLLRERGFRADYMAVGRSPFWDRADYVYDRNPRPGWRWLTEWWWFWRVMARYETVHFHFMISHTALGWELETLRRLGRNVVVHFRGCEARDRDRNMALHPAMNICQDCDYHPPICQRPESYLRRELAARFADLILVTTPDMLDFVENGRHFPFFAPSDAIMPPRAGPLWPERPRFKVVHATVHPGIEGTAAIAQTMEDLRREGFPIDFVFLRDTPHDQVLAAYADADLAIGKMKMGYYANAQIEALAAGVPTITWVRPDLRDPALEGAGMIFADLDSLGDVVRDLLRHPERLAAKRAVARESILRLHDNAALADRLIAIYRELSARKRAAG